MIVNAAAHTAGNLAASSERDTVLAIDPNFRAVYQTVVFTMSITFAALGAINLLIAANADDRLLRLASWANFVWMGAFGLLSLYYGITPGFISAAVIETVVLASIVF